MEANDQIHGTAALPSEKNGTDEIGAWVYLRFSLYVSEEINNFLSLQIFEPRKVQRVAYSLYQTRYPRRNVDWLNKEKTADSE